MSERKRYLIDVEMVSHNLSGNSEWCSVRIPADGPSVLPVRFRDLRDAPDDEQLRDRVAELERGRDSWARYAGSVCKERDTLHDQRGALRDRVAELEREAKGLVEAGNDIARERDEARREAEELRQELGELQEGVDHLRAENERLRAAASAVVRSRFDVDREYRKQQMEALRLTIARTTPPAEIADQPAPQTHYRENDLVLSTDGPVRLVRLVRIQSDALGVEYWKADPHDVALPPGERAILERDGTPTDEGLRRLAERAGVSFLRSAAGCNVSWTDERVFLGPDADRDDRRALAAALREMGGA